MAVNLDQYCYFLKCQLFWWIPSAFFVNNERICLPTLFDHLQHSTDWDVAVFLFLFFPVQIKGYLLSKVRAPTCASKRTQLAWFWKTEVSSPNTSSLWGHLTFQLVTLLDAWRSLPDLHSLPSFSWELVYPNLIFAFPLKETKCI